MSAVKSRRRVDPKITELYIRQHFVLWFLFHIRVLTKHETHSRTKRVIQKDRKRAREQERRELRQKNRFCLFFFRRSAHKDIIYWDRNQRNGRVRRKRETNVGSHMSQFTEQFICIFVEHSHCQSIARVEA